MSVAKGDYLLFLDSDDFFEDIFIEKMYDSAIEMSADMVICQYRQYHTMTGDISGIHGVNPRFLSRKKTRVYNGIPASEIACLSLVPWNKLCSHKFIRENGIYFQETHHYNDNYFSIITALSAKKIAIIPDTLIYYRVGMKTNTQSTHYNHPYDLFDVMSAVHQYLVTTNRFDKFAISFYEFLIGGCWGHLRKLQKYNCHHEIYSRIIDLIKCYDLSDFSLKNCHNKLIYVWYMKLIEYPYSKYVKENKIDSISFLIRHPLMTLSVSFYLLKHAWWYLSAYGLCEFFYQV